MNRIGSQAAGEHRQSPATPYKPMATFEAERSGEGENLKGTTANGRRGVSGPALEASKTAGAFVGGPLGGSQLSATIRRLI